MELGAAVEDWFQVDELVAAFTLVLAAVEDEDGSIVAVVVTSVVAVLEDLVLLLQPLRANPARIKVNNNVFFIGGLNYSSSDRAWLVRFSVVLERARSSSGKN